MSPTDFKRRFVAHVLSDEGLTALPDLQARLTDFVSFDSSLLEAHLVGAVAVEFLVKGGLPCDASPFLSFEAYSSTRLNELYGLYDMPRTLFPLGHNGSGDPLGIEIQSQSVVYLNHDRNMQRVFINSSVPLLAESLCWYQELRAARKLGEFLARLQTLDPEAAATGTMWHAEATCDPYWD